MKLVEKIKVALKLNKAYKEASQMGAFKSGVRTSEFWLNLLSSTGVFVAALNGVIDDQTAAIIIAASNGLYTIARAAIKAAADIKAAKQGTVTAGAVVNLPPSA